MNAIIRALVALILGTCLGISATTYGAAQADAAWVQPYGGCKEAGRYPNSEGADQCRAHGWQISRAIIVRPNGRVVSINPRALTGSEPLFAAGAQIRPCINEDTLPRRHRSCVWDARHRGNGIGQSYMVYREGGGVLVFRLRHIIAHQLTH